MKKQIQLLFLFLALAIAGCRNDDPAASVAPEPDGIFAIVDGVNYAVTDYYEISRNLQHYPSPDRMVLKIGAGLVPNKVTLHMYFKPEVGTHFFNVGDNKAVYYVALDNTDYISDRCANPGSVSMTKYEPNKRAEGTFNLSLCSSKDPARKVKIIGTFRVNLN